MNKIFKIIWSKARNCYVVVSEIAHCQGKGQGQKKAVLTCSLAAALTVFTLTGGVTAVQAETSTTAYAAGVGASANGENAMAVGNNAEASKKNAVAVGNGAKALAEDAMAIGNGANVGEKGNASLAIGTGAQASGGNDIVIGHDAKNESNQSDGLIVIGHGATVSNNGTPEDSIAIGTGANVVGANNIAIGTNAAVTNNSGNNAISLGTEAKAEKSESIAIGMKAHANNNDGIAAIAIGSGAEAQKDKSIAIGYKTLAENNGESGGIAIGSSIVDSQGNIITQTKAAQGNDIAFGVGAQTNNRNMNGHNGGSIAIGHLSYSNGNQDVAIGDNAKTGRIGTEGEGYVAIGANSFSNVGPGVVGYDFKTNGSHNIQTNEDAAAWKSTNGAVSVGNVSDSDHKKWITRQITGVAAGYNSTDAVNVAQLKEAIASVKPGGGSGTGGDGVHFYSVKETDSRKGNYNNEGATGTDALAAGVDAKATGNYATAVGNNAKALKENAVALGNGAIAGSEEKEKKGEGATAVGNNAKALNDNAVAIGTGARAEGKGATVIGQYAKATNDYATAFGGKHYTDKKNREVTLINEATGIASTAFGEGAQAKGEASLAFGHNTVAGVDGGAGQQSVAFGEDTQALGGRSLAFGEKTRAEFNDSVAFGNGSQALSTGAMAHGNRTSAVGQYTTTWGNNTVAAGENSTAFGKDAMAGAIDENGAVIVNYNNQSTKIDKNGYKAYVDANGNTQSGTYTVDGGETHNYVILAGPDNKKYICDYHGDIHEVTSIDANGVITAGNAVTNAPVTKIVGGTNGFNVDGHQNATAFGNATRATAAESTAWGQGSIASGEASTAFGIKSKAEGKNSLAGLGGQAVNENSIALGKDTKANNAQQAVSMAIGENAEASGARSLAIGFGVKGKVTEGGVEKDDTTLTQTTASGESAVSIGTDTQAAGQHSIAFGSHTEATKDSSLAIGYDTHATEASAVAIGSGTKVNRGFGVAVGLSALAGIDESDPSSSDAKALDGSQTVAFGYYARATATNAAALGAATSANVNGGVALGYGSATTRAAGNKVNGVEQKAYLKPASVDSTNNSTWTSTAGAVSVGNVGAKQSITRQITDVAAGSKDTDAVNVAQLKQAGFTVTANTDATAGSSIKTGETLDFKAADNAIVSTTKDSKTITVKVSKTPTFDSVTTGDTVINNAGLTVGGKTYVSNAGLNANKQVITNVANGKADNDAVNVSQLKNSRTVVTSSDKSIQVADTANGNPNHAYDIKVNYGEVANNTSISYKANGGTAQSVTLKNGLNFTNGANTTAEVGADGVVKVNATNMRVQSGKATYSDDGNGSISMTHHDGTTATISGLKDTYTRSASYDAANKKATFTRNDNTTYDLDLSAIANEAGNGKLNFKGDDETVISKKLNDTLTIKGGQTDASKLSDGKNVGVINEKGALRIELAKKIDLSEDGSVKMGDTTINNNGLTIKKGPTITNKNVSMNNQQIHNVAAGKKGTDAVNVDQLKEVQTLASKHTKVTVEGGTAPKGQTYVGKNLKINVTNSNGQETYDLKLADNLNIGEKGADGKDGKIGVNGKNGSSVVINGKDGTIGLNGKNGTNGLTIRGAAGKDGITRIVYKDAAGKDHPVATLDDGLKFKGDTGDVISKKLNDTLTIKGGQTDASKLSDGKNVGVINEKGALRIELAKKIDLSEDGSVKMGDTTINNNGLTIKKGPTITNKNVSMNNQQIHNVAAGKKGTDAVNVDQLKEVQTLASKHTKVTVEGGTAPKGQTYVGKNLKINVTNSNGQETYDLKLADNLNIGEKGADGKDGKIGVNGKNGSSVVINGKDGTIGLNGKDGTNGLTIRGAAGKPGVDGKDGITRIVYKDAAGKDHPVATLDDGLKFKGDTGDVISKKLNDTLTIKGGQTDPSKLSTGKNVGVVNEKGALRIELAKKIDLGEEGSVKTGDTIINNNGLTIKNGPTITKTNVSMNNQQIHNVAAGKKGTDAVNVDQLNEVQTLASQHTKVTVEGGTAPKDTTYVGKNLKINVTDNKGQKTYDLKLADNLSIGEKGADGKDGKIGVNGKDGSSVVINGKDGTIGLNGKDGTNGLTIRGA
ncbi:ESPR-type extended signal peptide-containing protein, partial [uncultured Megasphaera sp.]|uniref:ESPR-type extended signal peptide-containing protein n=1 Tax=uncultured Megasphaera sp. TaxID=165188 RepID=UPI0025FE8DA9